MGMYPQVYSRLGALLWIENYPLASFSEEFLIKVKRELIARIM